VSKYNGESFTHYTEKEGLSNNIVWSILEDKFERVWVSTEKGLSYFVAGVGRVVHPQNEQEKTKVSLAPQCNLFTFVKADGLKGLDFIGNSALIDSKNRAWWGSGKGLVMLDLNAFKISEEIPQPRLTGLDINEQFIDYRNIPDSLGNDIAFNGVQKFENHPLNLSLPYDKNHLTFHFAGIDWSAPHKIQYSYRMLGLDNNTWSNPSQEPKADYRNLPYGTHTFQVRTIGASQHWSKPLTYTFTIRPPWWRSWWAYGIYLITLLGSVWYYIKWRERALKQKQTELEHTVAERTAEVVEEKKVVEQKNREILDSITYAKRIQTAILPPPRVVKGFLKNSFILYLPKDIVAGDFYWMDSVEDTIYFAACDCTGHGVPGAMVSVVCNNALNRSLNEFAEREPGRIFDRTRELVLENFSKSDEEVKDGMDASLCALNLQTMELQWAGANNPLWIFRKATQSIEEHKPDKEPIGMGHEEMPFTTHHMELHKGDIIYLFTDGYADQFGGEKGKKLTRARFREFLLGIAHLDMEQQRESLLQFHDQYRGYGEQVDDICVMGVRV
jgi:hypothetical protein